MKSLTISFHHQVEICPLLETRHRDDRVLSTWLLLSVAGPVELQSASRFDRRGKWICEGFKQYVVVDFNEGLQLLRELCPSEDVPIPYATPTIHPR